METKLSALKEAFSESANANYDNLLNGAQYVSDHSNDPRSLKEFRKAILESQDQLFVKMHARGDCGY